MRLRAAALRCDRPETVQIDRRKLRCGSRHRQCLQHARHADRGAGRQIGSALYAAAAARPLACSSDTKATRSAHTKATPSAASMDAFDYRWPKNSAWPSPRDSSSRTTTATAIGDETQDKCPQSAVAPGALPVRSRSTHCRVLLPSVELVLVRIASARTHGSSLRPGRLAASSRNPGETQNSCATSRPG